MPSGPTTNPVGYSSRSLGLLLVRHGIASADPLPDRPFRGDWLPRPAQPHPRRDDLRTGPRRPQHRQRLKTPARSRRTPTPRGWRASRAPFCRACRSRRATVRPARNWRRWRRPRCGPGLSSAGDAGMPGAASKMGAHFGPRCRDGTLNPSGTAARSCCRTVARGVFGRPHLHWPAAPRHPRLGRPRLLHPATAGPTTQRNSASLKPLPSRPRVTHPARGMDRHLPHLPPRHTHPHTNLTRHC
jgi:hypothetical protein